MAAAKGKGDKGRGWDDSLKDLQARIDALARRKREAGEADGHSSAEVARALRAHRRGPGRTGDTGGGAAAQPTTRRPPAAGQQAAPPGDDSAAIVYRRDLPRSDAPAAAPLRAAGERIALDEAVLGREVARGDAGTAFAISTRVDELEGARRFSGQFRRKLSAAGSSMGCRIAAATGLADAAPEDMVFFDIESTGLASTPLFLIGAMVWEGDAFVVQQYMARTYAEEAAVIGLFADLCRGRRLLVSFNGKSYDLPSIRARAAATRVDLAGLPEAHLDLLHECRREWRDVLPDCKLQTLELYVCKRHRRGDIPSAEIPRAYHSFVRTADAWEMVEVLKHNTLDLLTLADLMTRLPDPAPDDPHDRGDAPSGR